LTERTCTLDGTYQLRWNRVCDPSVPVADCPLQTKDIITTIQYQLQSENFCAEVTVEVGIIGSLAVYEDAAYSIPRTAFIVGTRAYFLVKIDSELNTPAKKVVNFVDTVLVQVTVRAETDTLPIKLYDKKAVFVFDPPSSDPGVDIQVDNKPALTQEVGFNFILTKKLAASLVKNNKLKFTVGAEVQAQYSSTGKKRQGTDVESSTFSGDASFDPAGLDTVVDTSAGTNTGGVATNTGGAGSNTGGVASSSVAPKSSVSPKSSASPNPNPNPSGSSATIIASIFFIVLALLF